jgi:hypothetical protein
MLSSMKRLVALGAVILVLVGCSSTPAKAKPPTFKAGDSALSIARAIPGCKDFKNQNVPATATGLASAAGCTLDGFPLEAFSWKSTGDASTALSAIQQGDTEGYVAAGSTWQVVANLDGDLAGQKTAVGKAAKALGVELTHVGG